MAENLPQISEIPIPQQANILLIRLGALGDVIQTLPLANQLRLNFPDCRLYWIIEEKSLPVVEKQKDIDFIIFPKKEIFNKNPFTAFNASRKLAKELKARNIKITIDPQGLFKSGWISFLSGATLRLGLNHRNSREGNHLFQTHTLPFIPDGQMHRSDLFLQFIRLIGGEIQAVKDLHNLYFTTGEKAGLPALLQRLQIEKPFFILNIGTSNPLKRWSAQYWQTFIRLLKEEFPEIQLVLTGGGKADVAHLNDIGLKNEALFTSAVNTTNLRELMLLIRECQALISVDSLALHLGSACHKNCLGLFGGCAVSANTGPYPGKNYPKSLVLQSNIPCYPCRKKKCNHHSCMREISPDAALTAFKSLINY